MPYHSKTYMKAAKKLEKEKEEEEKRKKEEERIKREEEWKRQEEERKRLEEERERERIRREEEEHRKRERREIEEERLNKAQSLLALQNMPKFIEIFDESALQNRYKYTFTRTNQSNGKDWLSYPAKSGSNTEMIAKIYLMKKIQNRIVKDHFKNNVVRIMKHLGTQESTSGSSAMIRVYDVFLSSERIYIFMEPSLPTTLEINKPLEEGSAKIVARKIGEALAYIHSKGIAHLSIKPENIYFVSLEYIKLKESIVYSVCWDLIADGPLPIKSELVKAEQDNDKGKSKINYLPPEVYQNDTCNGSKVDIWSWGIMVCYLIAKQSPFKENQIQGNEIDAFCEEHHGSQELKDFLNHCLSQDTEQRMNFAKLLQMKWLN